MRAACLDCADSVQSRKHRYISTGIFRFIRSIALQKRRLRLETDECDRVRKMEVYGNDKFGE